MSQLISLIFSGGVSGALYAMLAIGLVLSFSTSKIFNFGHAAIAFSCAFVYYQLNSGLKWPTAVSAVAVVLVFAPLSGLIWDRLVFRHLAGVSESVKVVATIGVLLVMPAVVQLISNILRNSAGVHLLDTANAYQTPGVGPYPPSQWHLMRGLIVTSDQLIALASGLALFLVLWATLKYTRIGLVIRGAVDRPTLASLRGTRTSQVSALVWVSSFLIAGVAGIVAGPITGFGVMSTNYTVALFVAGSAAVLARLTSIPVAFVSGLALGALTNLSQGYLNGAHLGPIGRWIQGVIGLQASVPYWVLLIGLIILGADRRRLAGTAADEAAPPDYLGHLSTWRRRLPWALALFVLMVYSLGPISVIWRQAVELGLAMSLVFLSYTIVTGIGGMVSLAQTAFVTSAALLTGYLTIHAGWPFIPAAIVSVAVAGLLGCIVALPAMRLGGIALALATLALALLGNSVLFQIATLGNKTQGWTIRRPKIGPLDLSRDRVMVCVLFALVLAAIWMVNNLDKSASGRAMKALRASQPAAAACGVMPTSTKLLIFALSALMAGIGGVMVAVASGNVTPNSYPPNPDAFLWLATVVLWGIRRPGAAVIAGLTSAIFPRILDNGIHIGHVGWSGTTETLIPQILFGLGAITLANSPDGILSQFAERRYQRHMRLETVVTPTADTEGTVQRVDLGGEPQGAPTQILSETEFVTADGNLAESPLLELRDIHAGYGTAEVLHGINMTIPRQGITAIVGPNGAGKSTLCGVLAGTIAVTQGQVRFDGRDITDQSSPDRFDQGIVSIPESRGIFPSLTVDDNLSLYLRRQDERSLVYDHFPALAGRRRVAAGNLSGGEQQMLSLGPMLVKPPRLLIVDEPTLGLAELLAVRVMDAIEDVASRGASVVLIEEKARATLSVAEKIGVLYNGRIRMLVASASLDIREMEAAYSGGSPDL